MVETSIQTVKIDNSLTQNSNTVSKNLENEPQAVAIETDVQKES